MPIIRNLFGSVNESDSPGISRKISKKIDLLDKKMDNLYRDIYISRPDNKHNLDNVLNKLDTAIDNIQTNDISTSGMSELLRRIDNNDGSNVSKLMNSVGELFNDQNLVNTLFANTDVFKYISAQNYQYDMICRYLPKLLDALEIKRDNVLCSDNFNKDFLNPSSSKSSKTEIEKFSVNSKNLEKKYEISDFIDKTYMNVSKYGEDFIYVAPYRLALQRIIRRTNIRKNTARLGQISFYESTNGRISKQVETIVNEGYVDSKDYKQYVSSVKEYKIIEEDSKFKGLDVNIHFNDTNVVSEAVYEYAVLQDKKDIERFSSLSSIFEQSVLNEAKNNDLMSMFEKIDTKNNGIKSANSSDGLIIPDNLDRDPEKIDKDIRGAVVERLPRENIVPIYIGKVCMGYYFFEFAEKKGSCGFCGGHHMTPGVSNAANFAMDMSEDQQELAIRFIANRMSQSIDTHFINANKDLKEEIYSILRYNEKFDINRSNDIGVTFIPADDIVHCYNRFDENTHRGISDLERSVVPAMLYILLYLTDIIGKVTRSTDKRIYYVKQNVETNVARTMMNTVAQIKKGNFGMRQIESMNNMLNIVGKFNDFIIPLGQSGVAF